MKKTNQKEALVYVEKPTVLKRESLLIGEKKETKGGFDDVELEAEMVSGTSCEADITNPRSL